jgi:hypothetical protein
MPVDVGMPSILATTLVLCCGLECLEKYQTTGFVGRHDFQVETGNPKACLVNLRI